MDNVWAHDMFLLWRSCAEMMTLSPLWKEKSASALSMNVFSTNELCKVYILLAIYLFIFHPNWLFIVYLLKGWTSWHICLNLMMLSWKTVSSPSSCRIVQKYLYPPCLDLVRWHFATWVVSPICHQDKREKSQRERKVQRSSTQDDLFEGNERSMHCGNSEAPSSRQIIVKIYDSHWHCWQVVKQDWFFSKIIVITMLFNYADICCAEMQLHKALRDVDAFYFFFLKSSHGMMCLHSYVWRLSVWWKIN